MMTIQEKCESRLAQYLRLLNEAAVAAEREDQKTADLITIAAYSIGSGITYGEVELPQ